MLPFNFFLKAFVYLSLMILFSLAIISLNHKGCDQIELQTKAKYNEIKQKLEPAKTTPFNRQKKPKLNRSDVYSYIINPKTSICGPDYGKKILLIALSPSKPENYEERMTIRNTWSNKFIYKSLRNVFIIGLSNSSIQNEKIRVESQFYGDIIQANFLDTYYNLTLKTMSSIKWTSEYCFNAKFFLKVDDDMVVNSYTLLPFLENLLIENNDDLQNTLIGYCINPPVIRNNLSKFYVSKDEYEPDYYDTYCIGSAYIITVDLMRPMYRVSKRIKPLKMEDVYVGMLAKELNSKFIYTIDNYVYVYYKDFTINDTYYANLNDIHFVLVESLETYYIIWNMIYQKILNFEFN